MTLAHCLLRVQANSRVSFGSPLIITLGKGCVNVKQSGNNSLTVQMSEDCNPFSHILWPQGSQPKLVETAQATSMGFSCAGCPRPVKQMHYVFGGNRVCSFLSLLQSHSRVSTQRMASGFLVPLSLVDYPDFLYTLYAAMAAIVPIDEENTVCLFFGSHFATPILFSYQPQLYDSVRRPLDVIYPASRMTQY